MVNWFKGRVAAIKLAWALAKESGGERGGMTTTLVTQIIIGAIAFILIGVAIGFGPTMLTGFESMRTANNVSSYTGLTSVIQFGPTAILLGFIIMIGIVGFLGIKMAGKG